MVGCVIVHNGEILGEGYHLRAGEPHAEVIAINAVSARERLKLSTLYVNLEPCSHFGKTPPCADFIILNEIPRIVIGTIDTSNKVSGKGVSKLIEAGCDVRTGVLETECRRLNRRFFSYHEKRRPYIILKWAQSADGYLDIIRSEGNNSGPTWITGKPERVLVHKWRACEQTILAGAGTIRADNPRLDVRDWSGPNPLKLILSSSGTINNESSVLFQNHNTVLFTHNKNADITKGVKVILKEDAFSSDQICRYLYQCGIQSLFIEGGAEVLNHFISTGFWDEARIFTGKEYFREGVKAPQLEGILFSKTVFSGSSLEIYVRNGS
jgi:diaminohydroxyphosphoribosylaminopyrimidine deaminase/5-amino-6-(5-phosphoribosylamino)uracil reductase